MYTFDADVVSDLHKDARGFRPREGFWSHWNLSTNDEKQAIWDGLIREVDIAIAEDNMRKAQALEEFNTEIKQIMELGNLDFEGALDWYLYANLNDCDAESVCMYGSEYMCFLNGMDYDHKSVLDGAVERLRAKRMSQVA